MGNTTSSDDSNLTAEDAIVAAMNKFNESSLNFSLVGDDVKAESDSDNNESNRRGFLRKGMSLRRKPANDKAGQGNGPVEDVIRRIPQMDPQAVLRLLEKNCCDLSYEEAQQVFYAVRAHQIPEQFDEESTCTSFTVPSVIFAITDQ